MISSFVDYIDSEFQKAGAPVSKKTQELKEEIVSNMIEKYNDLLKSGYDKQRAFEATIIGLGDVRPLLADTERKPHHKHTHHHTEFSGPFDSGKRLPTTIAIGFIFLGLIIFLGSAISGEFYVSFSGLGICVAIAVAIFITIFAPYGTKLNFSIATSVMIYILSVFGLVFGFYSYSEEFLIPLAMGLAIATAILIKNFAPYDKKLRRVLAVSIALYIFAAGLFFYGIFVEYQAIIASAVLIACATLVIVYHFAFKPAEKRPVRRSAASVKRDRDVIDYRQINPNKDSVDDYSLDADEIIDDEIDKERIKPYNVSKLVEMVSSPTIVAIYLIYSFITGNWHISWIIFPVSALLMPLLKKIFKEKNL